jgi:Flp pilus assembly protein TadG
MSFGQKVSSRVAALIEDTQGGVSILAGLALPLVLGAAAFAIDTGYWYMAKRQTQQQADVAALGAARAKYDGATSAGVLYGVALKDAVRNGYTVAASNSLVVNSPPTSGAQAGNVNAVEVIVQRQSPSFFARVLGLSSVVTSGRAVVSFRPAPVCVLALHSTASGALSFSGNSRVDAAACVLATNSSSETSVTNGGSSTLSAFTIFTTGALTGSSDMTLVEPAHLHHAATADPYGDLALPPVGACNATNFRVSTSTATTINPGVYCGGITMSGSGTLYLNKGTYILNGGDLDVGGSSRLRCGNCTADTDGVTIILTATAGNVGTVSVSGGADIELVAPSGTGDTYRGVVIYQDRRAAAGNQAKLSGGAAQRISGAIYMPNANITYTGSSSLNAGKNCIELIGLTVSVSGSSGFNFADCKAMGVREAGSSTMALRE